MKKRLSRGTTTLIGLALASIGGVAVAQTPAPAAPASDWTLTGNAGLFSDYRFRGFTQTGYKPAFQGGFDLSHASGFYVGNWNSNVEQGLYRGASLEMDFYGGYKMTIAEDFGIDVGGYYYYYPTKRSSGSYYGYNKKAEEGEVYISGSWKWISAKYWYGLTNYFGLGDSFLGGPSVDTKGSSYLEVNANYDAGDGWTVVGHYGLQSVHNHGQFTDVTGATLSKNVGDYKVGVTKDLSGWVVGAAVVGTSKKNYFGTTDLEAGGKTKLLVQVSKTF